MFYISVAMDTHVMLSLRLKGVAKITCVECCYASGRDVILLEVILWSVLFYTGVAMNTAVISLMQLGEEGVAIVTST